MNDNTPSDRTVSAGRSSLRLRLVRSHGNPMDAVLSVPAWGVGLADALELDGQRLDDAQRREADLCRIDLQGRSWRMANDSHSLACSLNGERVPAGSERPVAHGDALEIGLLRFVVELAADDAEAAAFDLRDLAMPAHGSRSTPAQAFDDLFGALDIDGARPQAASDPLAELLGELPTAHRQPVPPAMQPVAEMASHAGRSHADPADALFDDLHAEFVRTVRDPARAAGNAIWESGDALTGEAALQTLEEMTRDAVEAYPLVRDVLEKPFTIDQTLTGFDTMGRSLVFDADEPDEVLRLFAPEVAHGIQASIPSLTRREHHALSPDSPMPIERVGQGGKQSA
ncbi:TagK domain-containing protein [Variovorax ureilyticus]|uniref:TagK domain-containing protein n=1 Tax=Variovorax ureilyticus TaxID=1836198 RepID=A0ABU8VAM1_9BURK